jgi:hypothetical protein
VRLQALTAASMKMKDFCDLAPYSLAEADRRFRGAYCRRNQGDEEATSTRLHDAIS